MSQPDYGTLLAGKSQKHWPQKIAKKHKGKAGEFLTELTEWTESGKMPLFPNGGTYSLKLSWKWEPENV
jgi:hypothetical protein